MTHRIGRIMGLGIGTTLVTALLLEPSPTLAGPVERALKRMGDDVSIPVDRPAPGTRSQGVNRRYDNRLDGATNRVNYPPAPEARIGNTDERRPTARRSGQRQRDATIVSDDSQSVSPSSVNTAGRRPLDNSCLMALQQIAEARRAEQPQAKDAACRIDDPIVMTATKGANPVTFSGPLLLDCPFAQRFAHLSGATAQALANTKMGTSVEQMQTGRGYNCRRRNNAATGKLSEHAFGNAVDIVGFRFADGRHFSVQDKSQLEPGEAAFQNGLRLAACEEFTTVLGPGANAAHATHLHFDLGRFKGRKNPYRICD